MAYEVVREPRGVYCRFMGVASDDDLRQVNLAIVGDPGFESLEYQIADFTDADKLAFSSEAIRLAAATDRDSSMRNSKMRVAIVGPQKMLLGLANMYRAHFDLKGGKWEQGHFDTLDEARAWLGLGD